MELEQVIKTRRSVRKFSEKKITKEVLEKIIEAGQYAPSHCNTQDWKFIFIDNPKIKNKIFDNGGSFVIRDAPYGILVVYNTAQTDNIEYQDWIQSSSAAIQNMLLTIHSLGLGGCWICHLPKKKTLNKILNIKKPHTPIGYIALGYPDGKSTEVPRKNEVAEIYSLNEFKWPAQRVPVKTRIKRISKKVYLKSPVFIKKKIEPLTDKFVKKFKN